MAKAKKLAGTDQVVARLVSDIRWDKFSTALTPDQARRSFQELRQAIATFADHDHNADGKLGFEEVPYGYADTKAQSLLLRAASPVNVVGGDSAAPRAWLSLEARREAETEIVSRATHHAKSPEGAEAIMWEMRLKVVEGMDVNDPIINDPLIYTEKDWRRFLPFVGEKYGSGKGHLSNKELQVRYGGDLKAYVEQTKAKVESSLMMKYDDFLAGVDL